MKILPLNYTNNFYQTPVQKGLQNNYVSFNNKNMEACFFTQTADSVSFGANTSAGNPLKKLKGIKCPYFGVEMLSGSDIARIEKRLDTCKNVKDAVTMPQCLKLWYDDAIVKLKLEEFNVLDDVDKISLKLSPQNALAVHAKTTRCRQVILENRKEDTFKRKILLMSLDDIKPDSAGKEAAVWEKLKDRAVYLPTSGTSENAFIVKYADRTQQEVAKRILRPSIATIEHIQPNSLDGENTIGNFLLASAGANSMRSNMPLTKFIEMYPSIPKKCQAYIEQVVDYIHRGWLKGNETYPYKVQKKLAEESGGLINLDLSCYKYSPDEAKARVVKYYEMRKKH